ncbi:hypothetical protein [Streptomyces sp. Ncost-T10-10d]|uniref:hypothetical protein n=1 Tax=Streptomyces sp. Ncost-T10-10d TaxID=1839774 RepID=UPI00081E3B16|nr:hypothetical protein [Streptomyces sp. Ncost-T10-10d]SCF87962.1 hypothetical protein GA0115254_121337 [Streptomyces sp. Ncost-T10-10d]
MYAPGHPPTPPRRVPSRAWIVSMRVLFVVLSVCSLGLLLWSPLLRLAIVRRRTSDWWLTGAGFVFVCVLLPILGRDGNDEPTGIDNILILLLLLAMAAASAYYLVGDIRHYEQLTKRNLMGGYAPPVPGYGYAPTVPMRVPAPAPMPVQQPPLRQPMQPPAAPPQQYQQPQPHPSVHPQPHPQPNPRPQRIDQVRAELDELSDYLRKEEGR